MCVLKEKYKDQIILGIIIAVIGVIVTVVLAYFSIPFEFVGFVSLTILVLYLLIESIKNASDLEKTIKSK